MTNLQKQANEMAITNAMNENQDSNHFVGYKTIDVDRAIWNWENNSNPIVFGPGYAYRSSFPATGDTIFNCPFIDGGAGGPSPTYSTAFQRFSFNKKQNILTIKGNMQGRKYTVKIFFKK